MTPLCRDDAMYVRQWPGTQVKGIRQAIPVHHDSHDPSFIQDTTIVLGTGGPLDSEANRSGAPSFHPPSSQDGRVSQHSCQSGVGLIPELAGLGGTIDGEAADCVAAEPSGTEEKRRPSFVPAQPLSLQQQSRLSSASALG